MVNLLLLVWLLRLRMEVWANRRVIAALEAVAHQSDPKVRPNRPGGVGLLFLFMGLMQVLLVVRELWS
jgi:hypothetical protein